MNRDKERELHKKLYSPKRVVNNRQSNAITHIIGSYNSHKMGGVVRFESQAEMDAYVAFEMSCLVWDYRPQPVEVEVKVYDKWGNLKPWKHIPDALVHTEDSRPCLYQIKSGYSKTEQSPKSLNIERACKEFAHKNDWDYKLIHMCNLDKNFRWNIRFLFPYLKTVWTNEEYSESIFSMLRKSQPVTIDELADYGVPGVERQYVLPVIFHELAKGILYIDLTERIDGKSFIRMSQENDPDYYKYVWELN